MRAIAASAVVLHHLYDLANGGNVFGATLLEGFGEWGVDLFFLLSAFLLCEYFWHPASSRPLRVFYMRRVLRLAPAYYVCFGLLFVLFAEHALSFSRQGLFQLFTNITFTHWLLPGTSSSLNVDGALWTLTIEALLYLAMPVLALAIWKWPVPSLVCLCAAGVGYRLYVAVAGEPLQALLFGTSPSVSTSVARLYLARQIIGFLPVFAVAITVRRLMVAQVLPNWLLRTTRPASACALLLLAVPSAAFSLLIYSANDYREWLPFSLFDLVVAVLGIPLLIYAGRSGTGQPSAFMTALVWLGRRSFGLYLWHFPVILAVYGRGPFVRPPVLSYLWLRVPLVLIVAITLAAASYRFVERPAMRYAQRLSRKWLASSSGRDVASAH